LQWGFLLALGINPFWNTEFECPSGIEAVRHRHFCCYAVNAYRQVSQTEPFNGVHGKKVQVSETDPFHFLPVTHADIQCVTVGFGTSTQLVFRTCSGLGKQEVQRTNINPNQGFVQCFCDFLCFDRVDFNGRETQNYLVKDYNPSFKIETPQKSRVSEI